jgi:hypothetical protein
MEKHDLNFSHVVEWKFSAPYLNIGDVGRRYQVWECTGDIMELGISCGLLRITETNIFTRGQPCRLLLLLRHRWSTPLLFSTWGLVSSFVLTQFIAVKLLIDMKSLAFLFLAQKLATNFFSIWLIVFFSSLNLLKLCAYFPFFIGFSCPSLANAWLKL